MKLFGWVCSIAGHNFKIKEYDPRYVTPIFQKNECSRCGHVLMGHGMMDTKSYQPEWVKKA